MNIETILQCLKEQNIEKYRINERLVETAELFFIRKAQDVKRMKRAHLYEVTVYRDFEYDGKMKTGFSSVTFSPSLSEKEAGKKIASAYNAASFVRNPAFELLPGVKEEPKTQASTLADVSLEDAAKIMANALFAADTAEDAFVNSAEIFTEKKTERILTYTGTDVRFTAYVCKGEFVTQCVAPQDVEKYVSFEYNDLATDSLTACVSSAIANVRDRAQAVSAPKAGEYALILSEEHVATVLDFYAERASAPLIYAGYSAYKKGEDVQGETTGERLNVTLVATQSYSDEGIPMQDRTLLSDGKLCCIPGATRFCSYLGEEPTGGYTSIRVDNGSIPLADMQKKPYLHVVTFSDFQMDAFSGYFGGEIRLAYLFDGETVTPVTGGSVSGNLLDLQKNLVFSTEKFKRSNYEGPLAVLFDKVSVAG